MSNRKAYESHGFHYFRDVLSRGAATRLADTIAQLSDLPADDAGPVLVGGATPDYRHGDVAAHPGLWPVVVHRGIGAAVESVLGAPGRCLPGIDTVGMHVAESEPHRDASPAQLPVLAAEPFGPLYPVVRMILYPGSPGESFGLLPGSHRLAGRCADVIGSDHNAWKWITLRGGDVLAFDPRLIHAGGPVARPKPMIVLTYGLPGPHAQETFRHARTVTSELGFTDPPPAYLQLLRDHDLLLDLEPM